MKVAVVGSNDIKITEKLKKRVDKEVARLVEEGADVFYFCNVKNGFDNLCYEVLNKYNVKRVLARAYFEMIDEDTADYKVEFTENKRFPENLQDDLKVYIKPDRDIIKLCDMLVTCCTVSCGSRTGSFFAAWYAKMRGKKIININEML